MSRVPSLGEEEADDLADEIAAKRPIVEGSIYELGRRHSKRPTIGVWPSNRLNNFALCAERTSRMMETQARIGIFHFHAEPLVPSHAGRRALPLSNVESICLDAFAADQVGSVDSHHTVQRDNAVMMIGDGGEDRHIGEREARFG